MKRPKREPAVTEEQVTTMALDADVDAAAAATAATDASVVRRRDGGRENAEEAALLAAALGGGAAASVVDATTFERRVEEEVRGREKEKERKKCVDVFFPHVLNKTKKNTKTKTTGRTPPRRGLEERSIEGKTRRRTRR